MLRWLAKAADSSIASFSELCLALGQVGLCLRNFTLLAGVGLGARDASAKFAKQLSKGFLSLLVDELGILHVGKNVCHGKLLHRHVHHAAFPL